MASLLLKMKSSCLARFSILLYSAQACEVRIHSAMTPPLPMKNRNSSKLSLSLIGFFQNLSFIFMGLFLSYGVLIWGNTYISNIQPLVILQKKAIRIITFSEYRSHTSPLFKRLNLLKLIDIVYLDTSFFMCQFNNGNLPNNFNISSPRSVNTRHQYGTRLASKSTFSLPKICTNYGKFNVKFFGPKTWVILTNRLNLSVNYPSNVN